MDELIDILDSKGKHTGKIELKSYAHHMGLFHATAHIWFYTLNGKVLTQQRGKHKDIFPLKWDVSVAGHIGAGESPELGAFREAEEEIGLTIDTDKLEKIAVLKKDIKYPNGIWDREFAHVFLYCIDEDTPLTKQDSEVEALQWLTIAEFSSWVSKKHTDLIPYSDERYQMIIKEIKSRIKATS